MYTYNSRQIGFHDEPRLFGGLPLNESNRWVKLAGLIPWGRVEDEYRKHFKGRRGESAKSVRLALDSLIVQEQMQLSDRDTVALILMSPCIQYFLGYPDYQYDRSLNASLLTYLSKHFPACLIAQVNKCIVDSMMHPSHVDRNGDGDHDSTDLIEDSPLAAENHGTLIKKTSYAPQGICLLHESCLKLESMMNTVQAGRVELKQNKCSYMASIHEVYDRPIVRRKVKARTEFGGKVTTSIANSFAEITNLLWDVYNASQDLVEATMKFHRRYSYRLSRDLAVQTLCIRTNLQCYKSHDTRWNGSSIGCPPKAGAHYDEQLRLERVEFGERNAIEGKFGEGKRRISFDPLLMRLKARIESPIYLVFVMVNFQKILSDLCAFLCSALFQRQLRSAMTLKMTA